MGRPSTESSAVADTFPQEVARVLRRATDQNAGVFGQTLASGPLTGFGVVPEPGTGLLLAAGLGILAARRRR